MSLERIADHVARRLARLVMQYRESASHKGVVSAFARQAQELEDVLFGMLALRSIADSAGAQLDALGRVLGAEREGRDDAAYRLRLQAQVLVNRRSGEVDTLLRLLRLLAPDATRVAVEEHFPAALVGTIEGVLIADPSPYVGLLREAKAAGVRALLAYQPAADDDTFTLSDTSGAAVGGLGLGDTNNAATGGQLAGIT